MTLSGETVGSFSPYGLSPEGRPQSITVEIGGIPILLETASPDFCGQLEARYAGFLSPSAPPACQFEISLQPPAPAPEEDVRVFKKGRVWRIERGDFRAEWDAQTRRGWVRQSPNPYAIDAVLRIVHSLVLAEEGGFLVHAASAVRRGRGFLFAGVSGAGKTTLVRLAPADATVLTDEISYVRPNGTGHRVHGTPFAGELARVGANDSAPLAAVYLLEKGPENRKEPVGQLAAARALLRHILFFAEDVDLVKRLFDSALEFVSRVNVMRLFFAPNERAWEQIG